MGRKYIIELEERPFYSSDPMVVGTELMAERLYRVKGFKSLVFDEEGLKRLTPYEEAETKLQINYEFSTLSQICDREERNVSTRFGSENRRD